jgi:hypothetical protein
MFLKISIGATLEIRLGVHKVSMFCASPMTLPQ